MIIVKLKGGLGNQLFQYAVARHLAEIHNTSVKLDISLFKTYKLHAYSLSPFNIQEKIASQKEIEKNFYNIPEFIIKIMQKIGKIQYLTNSNYICEKFFNYDSDILSLPDNVYLDGYWQSEKYFTAISEIIRSEYSVKQSQFGVDKQVAEKIKSCDSVCVHVRRGSYTMPPYNSVHGTCPINYYHDAIRYISNKLQNPHFFIFSDDPNWTGENLKINHDVTFVNHNDASKDYEDLRLMSQCKHHIIANSTYSWWSAWLCENSEKIVIAPKKWFNSGDRDIRDLFPESWIKL